MKLREEKGYTYGARAGFDLRRAAGPFSARAAVNTEVTAPALSDLLAELDRIRAEPVTDAELRAARDFLIGVFPLRFETPGPSSRRWPGSSSTSLPDDELARYRERIDAVSADDVLAAAQAHLRPRAGAPTCSSATPPRSRPSLEVVGFGPVEVIRDDDESAEA